MFIRQCEKASNIAHLCKIATLKNEQKKKDV